MMIGWGGFNFGRRIERLSRRVNARPRKKRKRPKGSGRLVGPKLVKGRGMRLRRPKSGIDIMVYLLVAAGLTIAVFKYILVPIIS